MKVYPFFVCKENSSCAPLSAPQLLCVHLLEKGLLWPVTVLVLVLWMGTKALISIHLCFTVVSFLEYPYPMTCAFCYFKCVATCSLKGLFFSRRACWCQWLALIAAGGMVPGTPEISALQGNLPFSDLLSAYLKYISLHAWSVRGTPLPSEFIMTSEIAGVAGRWASIVFHWLLCSAVRDYICCAMGRCMLWTVYIQNMHGTVAIWRTSL